MNRVRGTPPATAGRTEVAMLALGVVLVSVLSTPTPSSTAPTPSTAPAPSTPKTPSNPLVVGTGTAGAVLGADAIALPLAWAAAQGCPTCFPGTEAGLGLTLVFLLVPPSIAGGVVDSVLDAHAGMEGPVASIVGVVGGYCAGAFAGALAGGKLAGGDGVGPGLVAGGIVGSTLGAGAGAAFVSFNE